MLEAGINLLVLISERVNQSYQRTDRRFATCSAKWIFCGEQVARSCRRGCSRNNELWRWKAGPLIRLKHTVTKRVLFAHLKIRLHFRGVDVHELRIGRRTIHGVRSAADGDFVRSVHFPAVIHVDESWVRVAEVVVVVQVDLREWNGLASGVHAAVGDVRVRETVEQIIRRAILLEDYHHVFEFLRIRGRGRRSGAGAAAASASGKTRNQSY